MRREIVALLLVAASVAYAEPGSWDSYRPAPGPTEISEPEQPQSSSVDEHPATDQRGTKQAPLVVEVINPEPPEAERDHDAQEQEAKAANERRLADETERLADFTLGLIIATGCLVAVAVVQAILFLWQLGYMRKGVRDAEVAANAAQRAAHAGERTVETMKDTAKRQLRAYVLTTNSRMERGDDGIAVFSVEVTNTGQTPAHKVRIRMGVEFVREGKTPKFRLDDPVGNSVGLLARDGSHLSVIKTDERLGDHQIAALAAGQATLYVFGDISYFDAFEAEQYTRFRLMCGGEVGVHPEGRLAVSSEGNDAT